MSTPGAGGAAHNADVHTGQATAVRRAGPVQVELDEEVAAVEIIKDKLAGVKQALADKQTRVKELRALLNELGQEG